MIGKLKKWWYCTDHVRFLESVIADLETAIDAEHDAAQQFLAERNKAYENITAYGEKIQALQKTLQQTESAKQVAFDKLLRSEADRLDARKQLQDMQAERNFSASALEVEAAEHDKTRLLLKEAEEKVKALLTLDEVLSRKWLEYKRIVDRLKESTDDAANHIADLEGKVFGVN